MTIYYEQSGHGRDVVLIHGWGSHGGVWTEIARELVMDFRVTVPDLPGHGRTRDFAPHAFTPEAMAEQIRGVLHGPAVWVGWSMGGLVALAAAQQLARAVPGFVLVNATPKYVQSPDWPHAMQPSVLEQFAQNLEQDYAGTLERFLTLQMAAGEDRAVLRRLREEMFRYGEPVTAALHAGLRLLKEEDRRDVLGGNARAVSITSSHWAVVSLSGQMILRTSSANISAAVPGSDPRPAALRSARNCRTEMPKVAAPCQISSGEKAWMWIPGQASLIAAQIAR